MRLPIQKLAALTMLAVLAATAAPATAPVPRKSDELLIAEPSGKVTPLSALKGKVVVIEFELVNCPHCLKVAKMLDHLHREMSPRGLQTVGIAFDNAITGKKVADFAQETGSSYMMGYTSSLTVDSFLGRQANERLMVPQIVVIDRNGTIRAQSRPLREVNLEDQSFLRNLVESLLAETGPATSQKKSARPYR
jgi:peroxiredoxin